MDWNLVIAIIVTIGIALMFLGLDLIITGRQIKLQNRISVYGVPEMMGAAGQSAEVSKSGRPKSESGLATELARAGLPVTTSEFLLATVLVVALGALVGLAVLQHFLGLVVGGLIGLIAPRLYLRWLQYRRSAAFNRQLESMITLLSNTLRAGYGLGQSIETVAKESPPPLSVEFDRVVREMALGVTVHEALANLLRRNPSGDLDLIVTAIRVNHEVGGNLAEVLDRIATTIRDRVRLNAEIRALTAMQRTSAQILIALPFAVFGLLYVMNSQYIGLLWQSMCGIGMLVTWGMMTIAGILVIRRLLKFRY